MRLGDFVEVRFVILSKVNKSRFSGVINLIFEVLVLSEVIDSIFEVLVLSEVINLIVEVLVLSVIHGTS